MNDNQEEDAAWTSSISGCARALLGL